MTDIMDRLDELERAAQSATQGPWQVKTILHAPNKKAKELKGFSAGYDERYIITAWDHPQAKGPIPVVSVAFSPYFGNETKFILMEQGDADYIAAADPSTVLALIAAIRERDEILREIRPMAAWESCEYTNRHNRYQRSIGVEPQFPDSDPNIAFDTHCCDWNEIVERIDALTSDEEDGTP